MNFLKNNDGKLAEFFMCKFLSEVSLASIFYGLFIALTGQFLTSIKAFQNANLIQKEKKMNVLRVFIFRVGLLEDGTWSHAIIQ